MYIINRRDYKQRKLLRASASILHFVELRVEGLSFGGLPGTAQHPLGGKLYLLKKARNTACNAAVYPALRYYARRLKPLNPKHLSQHCTPKSLYKQPHKHQQTTTHPTTRYNLKLRNHARTDTHTHTKKKNKYLKQTPREALKPINKHTKMLCIKNLFIILH